MNSAQKTTLVISALLLVLMAAFPPHVMPGGEPAGYGFIASPPERLTTDRRSPSGLRLDKGLVDYWRLGMQGIVVVVAGTILAVAFREPRPLVVPPPQRPA